MNEKTRPQPKVRAMRQHRGMSQVELALASGLSLNTITHAEAGLKVTRTTKAKIADALVCTVDDLWLV